MIGNAISVDGWMLWTELEWLAANAKRRLKIVEVGSWMGRSTRVLADSTPEPTALELLQQVAARSWPIIAHPDAMHTPSAWACLGDCLCIENMDKRKPIGQTATDLAKFFEVLPNAFLCFDIGHARQVDPTMSEAWAILQRFRSKIKQLHVSEVNTQSKHDPISLESILAFQKVSHLLPADAPIILESRVEESEIDEEIETALAALSPATQLAIASD
jgi:hypothetical protein